MAWLKRHWLVVAAAAIFLATGAAIWAIPQLAQNFDLSSLFGGPDASLNASADPAFAPLLQVGVGYNSPDANCSVPTVVATKPVQPPLRIFYYTPKDFAVLPVGNPPVVFRGFNSTGPMLFTVSGYTGPIMLKGLMVRPPGSSALAFRQSGGRSQDMLAFKVTPNQVRRIELKPSKPGCYVLQIAGTDFVEDIYFKAN